MKKDSLKIARALMNHKPKKLTGKAKVIADIKAIINTYGEFTTADVEANSSPVIANGRYTQTLAEEFGKHKVTGIEYFKDEEWNQDFYTYEELTVPVLKEILFLAKIHKEMNEE